MRQQVIRNLKYLIYIIFFILFSGCALFEKVPNVNLGTSRGVLVNSSIFFAVRYHIFYAPKGIARFPDGGRVQDALKKYYFYRYMPEDKVYENIAEFSLSEGQRFLSFKHSRIYIKKNILYFKYSYYDKLIKKEGMVAFDLNRKLFIKILPPIIFPKQLRKVSITETAKYFKRIFNYSEVGLPDPIAYIRTSKSDRKLVNVLQMGDGNRNLRFAIIGRFLKEKKYDLISKVLEDYTSSASLSEKYFREEEKKIIIETLQRYSK
ncbi:MAG: hypothetical protein SVR08_00370 [Spirochaetota bacterium]|nr:hypothetical protein [Spirochaetota bacterium]